MSSFSIQKMVEGFSIQTMGAETVSGLDLIKHYLDYQLRPTWNSMSSFQKESGIVANDLVVPPEYPAWVARRIQSPAVTLKLRETVTRVYAQQMGAHLSAALHAMDDIQDAICGVGMQFTQRKPSTVACFDLFGNSMDLAVQPWLTDRFGDLTVKDAANAPGLIRAMLEPFDLLAHAYQCMPVTGGLAQIDDDLCILFEIPLPSRESESHAQLMEPDRKIKVDPARYHSEEVMLPRIHRAVANWLSENEKPWLTVVRPTGTFQKVSAYSVLWGVVRTTSLRQPGVGVEAVQSAFKDLYSLAAESTLV